MCLLITQHTTSPILTDEWLQDFYAYNPDGAGIMYVENGRLQVHKVVPKDATEFIRLYRDHAEGRDCAIHLRFKTHGAIDYENTHPYEVFNSDHPGGALWMMHNGVLSTGNAKDVTKSDTWHFIRDYLRPMLERDRELLHTPQFQTMLGTFIGNNRFTFLDESGRIVTINEHQGLTWGGRWMSNTYAWTAPRYRLSTTGYTPEEIAQLEVSEGPVAVTAYKVGDPRTASYGGSSMSAATYLYDDPYLEEHAAYAEDYEDTLAALDIALDAIEWLEEAGYPMGELTEYDMEQFILQRGYEDFYELCRELTDGQITLADFAHLIRHPEKMNMPMAE